MNFTKLQGAGNDFVLVETSDLKQDWSQLAVSICNRRFGVGADGLLLVIPSPVADFRMRIFNPDGSEAEACGNGLRCFVRYLTSRGLVPNTETSEVTVETGAGISKAKIERTRRDVVQIQVNMGVPRLKAAEIPVTIGRGDSDIVDIKSLLGYTLVIDGRRLPLSFVSMGNPHAVYFGEEPVADFPLAEIGPRIERHQIFPNRVNFEVARVLGRQQIEARVWERGAGETLACGTGACAIAVAAQIRGSVNSKVDIILPGGTLNVTWDGVGEVLLGGPAEIVFTGDYPEPI
jgi:diaminopimelate epimerase